MFVITREGTAAEHGELNPRTDRGEENEKSLGFGGGRKNSFSCPGAGFWGLLRNAFLERPRLPRGFGVPGKLRSPEGTVPRAVTVALFPQPQQPPRGSRESRGCWGPGRPHGTPGSGASHPERMAKMLENTLKRSNSWRREAPRGSRPVGPGPGRHEAGAGFGSGSRGAGGDAGWAKRGERRGTGKARPGSPAAPSPPSPLPLTLPACHRGCRTCLGTWWHSRTLPVLGRAGKGTPSPAERSCGARVWLPRPCSPFWGIPGWSWPCHLPQQGLGTLGSPGVPAPI